MSYGLTFSDLTRYVARYLGYNPSSLSTRQTTDINDIIKSGYRRFLDPPSVSQNDRPHQWSFLKATGTITTVDETEEYEAPADFSAMETEMTFAAPTDLYRCPITHIPEAHYRRLRQNTITNNYPTHFTIRWQIPDGGDKERPFFYLWPTPADEYSIVYRYSVSKTIGTGSDPVLGSDVHSETVLAACLAAASRIMDQEGHNDHERMFLERLSVSVAHDQRMMAKDFGYNGDGPSGYTPRRAIQITHAQN